MYYNLISMYKSHQQVISQKKLIKTWSQHWKHHIILVNNFHFTRTSTVGIYLSQWLTNARPEGFVDVLLEVAKPWELLTFYTFNIAKTFQEDCGFLGWFLCWKYFALVDLFSNQKNTVTNEQNLLLLVLFCSQYNL